MLPALKVLLLTSVQALTSAPLLAVKQAFDLEEYSLSQATLEQVRFSTLEHQPQESLCESLGTPTFQKHPDVFGPFFIFSDLGILRTLQRAGAGEYG